MLNFNYLSPKQINDNIDLLDGRFHRICYGQKDCEILVHNCYVIERATGKQYHNIDRFTVFFNCPQLKDRGMEGLTSPVTTFERIKLFADVIERLVTPTKQPDGTMKSKYSIIEINEYLINRCIIQRISAINISLFERNIDNYYANKSNRIVINDQTPLYKVKDTSARSLDKSKFINLFTTKTEIIERKAMKDFTIQIAGNLPRIKKRVLEKVKAMER